MPENRIFSLTTNIKKIEFYFGGIALQYRTPEMEYPSRGIEKANFRVSQGTEIRTKNKESFESKAPSTRIRIFLKTHLFLSVLC